MSELQIEKAYPAWPEHADFNCPHCYQPIIVKRPETDQEYGYFCREEGTFTYAEDCPYCGKHFLVTNTIQINVTYRVRP